MNQESRIKVIPGINENNLAEIVRKIELVEPYVDLVDIDVFDNTLIKMETYRRWQDFKQFRNRVNLEAHIMVSDPTEYVDPMVKNGFDRLIAQVEGNNIRDFLEVSRSFDIEVGLSLDEPSPLELIEPYLEQLDVVQFMGYRIGSSGRPFTDDVLTKIKEVHNEYPELPIQVDGGINKDTAKRVIEAGATRLVSTSYLFSHEDDIEEAMEDLSSV